MLASITCRTQAASDSLNGGSGDVRQDPRCGIGVQSSFLILYSSFLIIVLKNQ
jgi:hypothetical protein